MPKFNYRKMMFLLATVILTLFFTMFQFVSASNKVTVPQPVLEFEQSGERAATAPGPTETRRGPVGVVPAKLPDGGSAIYSVTIDNDRYAGTWNCAPSCRGNFVNISWNADTNLYMGLRFQDNTNGLGYGWSTFQSNAFFSQYNGYIDQEYGSKTTFEIELFKTGFYEVRVLHKTPDGSVVKTETISEQALPQRFDPEAIYFPRIQVGIGYDTLEAWSYYTSDAYITVDSKALHGGKPVK
jgi:hypothetical protein